MFDTSTYIVFQLRASHDSYTMHIILASHYSAGVILDSCGSSKAVEVSEWKWLSGMPDTLFTVYTLQDVGKGHLDTVSSDSYSTPSTSPANIRFCTCDIVVLGQYCEWQLN